MIATTPEKQTPGGQGRAMQIKPQDDRGDCDDGAPNRQCRTDTAGKFIANMAALAAMAGASLQRIEGDDGDRLLVLKRGAYTRQFHPAELGELHAAIAGLGGC